MTRRSFKNRFNRLKDRLLSITGIRLAVGTIEELGRDDASHLAAGVAYFAMLSLFPLLLGFIALAGIFLPSETVQQAILRFMEDNLPIAADIVVENIESIIASRNIVGAVSFIALLWTSSNMFTAIGVALNRSCGVSERRPFYLRKPRDIVLSLGAGFLFLVSGVLPTVFNLLPAVVIPFFGNTTNAALLAVGSILTWVVFIVMYTYLPTTRHPWHYIWPGAVLATALFEVLRYVFIYFVEQFSRITVIYGPIYSAIALMIWIYLSGLILLAGSVFNDQVRRLADGILTLDADKPI
ncbi:YihY/virulence factor BrkB family protein [Dehalogenimonas sp. 4OHTPN]|uniref:YihY/virulence factor BrkB family protein n=1 Tax=Dehalogenimonas sp. 4OHTPN TaxID=3166643 RepID=A0AAU8G8C2_9CHLR